MTNKKKRSRTVSFRLSEEEYNSLKSISEASGARNVSDFTRSAAFQNHDRSAEEREAIQEMLEKLKSKLDLIDHSINKLAKANGEEDATGATGATEQSATENTE